jgi:hypothetical protein
MISKRLPGTGEWFINEQCFKEWVAQTFMTLFCPGIPGAGKTMMSAIIIHHLESEFMDNRDVGIAYIYCTYQGKQEEQKVEKMVLSLVKQASSTTRRYSLLIFWRSTPKMGGSRP